MEAPMMKRDADGGSGGTAQMTIVVRAVVLVLAILTTLICGLRLYLRKFVLHSFGLDDWMVILALIAVNAFSAMAFTITFFGLGADTVDVPPEDLVVWFKIQFGTECCYLIVGALVKFSLTIFILRLFPNQSIRIAGLSIMAFIAVFTIAMTFALAFQCRPVNAAYDKSITDAKCWTPHVHYAVLMTQGVIMFFLDALILSLPIRPVWKLQMPVKKRLMILGLFAIGFLACIAALVRFSTLSYTQDSTNFTKSASTSLIWMVVEFNLGLMSGSLSSLRKLFKSGPLHISSSSCLVYARRLSIDYSDGFEALSSRQPWKGIRKDTEITRVFETNTSQERIAPIYGQGELMTTTNAYAEAERERKRKKELDNRKRGKGYEEFDMEIS
ncbi:hypothetical protein ASPVEDRAFT_23577 [Aspergillus versicolor CBS 583.65]|uniref:Rhodopsin domain-containing protein n=1 Tax=Aspergillus versicolor CBS 583.65 TaxID=1036611 RepID=A0A1L9P4X3_ASPVE|nr:uncharacterized protein ASPVEDRAFT_23577 [Aspergillus versicolor CBS 583.65]OJI96571.1 hypothetical protein ASPVEDRAFT_23577 [Aspergillus versicolor CBS 583.65]